MHSNDCPTYEDILAVFPDTSNVDWSGDFGYYNGIYQRENNHNENHFEWYRANQSFDIQWIDPPADIRHRIKMINIEVTVPQYKIKESDILANGTYAFGHTRWNDDRCREATVSADNWVYLIGDTITYMKNDCDPGHTNLDTITNYYQKKTAWDYTQSYFYQLEQWFKQAIMQCGLKLCL